MHDNAAHIWEDDLDLDEAEAIDLEAEAEAFDPDLDVAGELFGVEGMFDVFEDEEDDIVDI